MSDVLNKNTFLVKEHVGVFKAANNFDIYDPETGSVILECREDKLGFFTKMFRFTDYKRMTPFHIEIRTPAGEVLIQIKRGVTWFRSRVDVLDGSGKKLGGFVQKMLSIGGAFRVLDTKEQEVCFLQGKWTGWDFQFMQGEKQLAQVSKKWAGLGKELFTSADNYVLQIDASVPTNSEIRSLIIAAVMCIDMVLKE